MSTEQAPPQYSADGHWWWTGTEWVPAQRLAQGLGGPTVNPLPKAVEPAPEPEPEPEPVAEAADLPQIPVFEILPSGLSDPPKRPGALRAALAGSVAAVLLIGAGAAYGVGHYLGGGGQQPDEVLPGNAVAVVRVDLDPSLSQKAALFQLSRAFPMVRAKSRDSLKDDLLGAMFSSGSMRYDKDIKPWLGDRVAVAAVPSKTGFEPVAAVQYTDKGKAKSTLLAASARAATGPAPFFFAFAGDYAVLASTQAAADRYAAAPTHLSDNPSYRKAVGSLDGDQVAVAWADLKGVYAGLPLAQRKANPLFANVTKAPTGDFVVGVHANAKYLEVQGRAVDVADSLTSLGAPGVGKARVANLIGAFPNDTTAAVEVAGLGDAMTLAYKSLPPPVATAAAQFGLRLPGDLAAVLGTDTAVGVLGGMESPTFLAHVRTKSGERAVAVLKTIAKKGEAPPFTVRRDAAGYILTTDPGAKTTGRLGSTSSYARAAPDAKTASFVAYVNIARLGLRHAQSVGRLDAFGMTVDGTTGAFRMRLTVRG